jgi:hypothetical protein
MQVLVVGFSRRLVEAGFRRREERLAQSRHVILGTQDLHIILLIQTMDQLGAMEPYGDMPSERSLFLRFQAQPLQARTQQRLPQMAGFTSVH